MEIPRIIQRDIHTRTSYFLHMSISHEIRVSVVKYVRGNVEVARSVINGNALLRYLQ